jgi:hypothetical protein
MSAQPAINSQPVINTQNAGSRIDRIVRSV